MYKLMIRMYNHTGLCTESLWVPQLRYQKPFLEASPVQRMDLVTVEQSSPRHQHQSISHPLTMQPRITRPVVV